MRYLIPVLLLAFAFLVAACADDPIIGPTDDDSGGGGSYGIIHFESEPSDQGLEQFVKQNPERF